LKLAFRLSAGPGSKYGPQGQIRSSVLTKNPHWLSHNGLNEVVYALVVPLQRQNVVPSFFNPAYGTFPYELRREDFELAMRDVYDFFFDVNDNLIKKGLPRLEEMVPKANLSGTLSAMLTSAVAKHSRTLVQNGFHNGHPDLIVQGVYPNDSVKAGEKGVEIKTTGKKGGAVDTHGARKQWMCTFVYVTDLDPSKAAIDRNPLRFTEVYLAEVDPDDFRKNERGELGTRTATLDKDGIKILRARWVYLEGSTTN
jgi:hypothetical protein